MTYKELLPIVMGVQVLGVDATNKTPKYVTQFMLRVRKIVEEERSFIEKRYGVDVTPSQYDLPYNYLIGKVSGMNGKVRKTELDGLLENLRRKVQYDLLRYATDTLMVQAFEIGDRDITI